MGEQPLLCTFCLSPIGVGQYSTHGKKGCFCSEDCMDKHFKDDQIYMETD